MTFDVRNTLILDPALYFTGDNTLAGSSGDLQLVAVVSGRADAEAVLRVWDLAKGESLTGRSGMSVLLIGIGEERVLESMPPEVRIHRVKNSEEFATRTGIRVIPFSLVIARDDHVLAAGPGLPEVSFIRDAVERFTREGARATTMFRRVSAEVNSALTVIEAPLPAGAQAR